MKRIFIAGLIVASAALVLPAIGASPAAASECFQVDNPEVESGNFETRATCLAGTPLDEGGNWFKGTADRDEFLPCVKVQLDLNFIIGYTSLLECQKESTIPGGEWLMATLFKILEPILLVEAAELEDFGAGESKPVKLTLGEMNLKTKTLSIVCKTGEGAGTAIGGVPATGKLTIKLKGCEVPASKCKVMNEGGVAETIEFSTNVEVVYPIKKGFEEGLFPYSLLFKTTAKGKSTLVSLQYSEPCATKNGPVTATGGEHGAGIEGIAAFACRFQEPAEELKASHEISCSKEESTVFFYGIEGKTIGEGKAGIEILKEKGEPVGKGTVEFVSKEKFFVAGV